MANTHSNVARCNDNGLIPAVAYIRMSTDDQADSPDQQRRESSKYAAANGYKIIREYIDEGISGWKDTREGFQRLIDDLGVGDFQAVLCWDQNRFSRFPVLEANHYWYLLDRAGVHLATVNQGRLDWHSIAGWLTASITQYGDAQHRHKLAADVRRGMSAVASRGLWQGRAPTGYAIGKDRKLVLGEPHEVAMVRRIFTEYIEGKSIRTLCHEFATEGKTTRNGCAWTAASIRNIIKSETYLGTYKHGDVTIEDNHPAIIDRATFDTANRKLGERRQRTTPFRNGGGFLFSGLIRCGKCGSPMRGKTQGSGRKTYGCSAFIDRGAAACSDRNTVSQWELANHVIDAIVERFTNPKVIKQIRTELHRQVKTTTAKVNIDHTRKQLASVETKLTKAKRRLVEVDVDMLPVVQEQIRDLDRQRTQLQSTLKSHSTPQDKLLAAQDIKVDTALALFARLRETLHKSDAVHLRELLAETVEQVEVCSQKRPDGQGRFDLVRGVIHMRVNNLFSSARRSCGTVRH